MSRYVDRKRLYRKDLVVSNGKRELYLLSGDVVDQVFLQHVSPLADYVQESLLERPYVDFQPSTEDLLVLQLVTLIVKIHEVIDLLLEIV